MSTHASAFFARQFTTEGQALDLTREGMAGRSTAPDVLIWVDLLDPPDTLVSEVWATCGLPEAAKEYLSGGTTPAVWQQGAHLWVRCVAPDPCTDKTKLTGTVLVCVAGANHVITIHRTPIAFLDDMRHPSHGQAAIGSLSAESFVATVLDRQLAGYFDAVSDFEMAIERLEVDLMGPHGRHSLPELQRLRRWASRLRRMLAPHRNVFGVMSRPDFRPDEGRDADRHFVALDTRFERAMDMVEHARELVIGSFELFSSQTALRTNDGMRVLTFATVITGLLATLVGILGMNFQASFFETNDVGFWVTVAFLVVVGIAAVLVARLRRWI